MSDAIQPALTAEEWEAALGREDWQREMELTPPMVDAVSSAKAALCNIPVASERRHLGLAALALYGYLTRDDVEAVLDAAAHSPAANHAADLRDLAARIAALLPPETP